MVAAGGSNHHHHHPNHHVDFDLSQVTTSSIIPAEEDYGNEFLDYSELLIDDADDEIDVDNYIFTNNNSNNSDGRRRSSHHSTTKRRNRISRASLNRKARQSIRKSVQLLAALNPHRYDHRNQVTLRVHSIWSFLTLFGGSVTEYTWPKVMAYTVYLTLVSFVFNYGCPSVVAGRGGEGLEELDVESMSMRCHYGDTKLKYEEMFGLWMVFTGFLFTSFVAAGLERFRDTLGLIRRVQGRINEISLLLHSHCKDPKDQAFAAVIRLLTALPFILYSPPQFGQSEYFILQAAQYLSEDQFERLDRITNPNDRPYAAMLWINRIVLESLERDPNSAHPPPFTDPYGSFSIRLTSAMESLRGAYGSLNDSLDDAILPFPFANLIICNIYLVFAGLPFSMVHNLGYGLVPAGAIYFWFLDGMVTFVFLVDQPFDDKIAGRKNISQPLIDLHKAIEESVAGVPRRFPSALAHQPKYQYVEEEKEQRI